LRYNSTLYSKLIDFVYTNFYSINVFIVSIMSKLNGWIDGWN